MALEIFRHQKIERVVKKQNREGQKRKKKKRKKNLKREFESDILAL